VHGRWGRDTLGIDSRQLGGVDPEHVGQHVREILQQMEAVGHLARCRSPCARRFRVCLRAIPHEDLDPGMRLQPLGHGGGLPIGEQGERSPAFEITHERAIGVTLP
jgi:hypothetical protein